jgi:tRNA (guanine-N7-)-methyltransferase
MEVGTGKGQFLYELARRHPTINYLGVEKFDSAIVKALYKLMDDPLDNLRLLRADAVHLGELLEAGSVERIYLNFSDPWPKARHEKRRLTHPSFLALYQRLLVPGGEIHFKTDNRDLFEYSIETMTTYGMEVRAVTYDLHNEERDVVTTEFEDKFRLEGKPIHRLIATYKEEAHG